MFEKQAKDQKQSVKTESKVTRTMVHSFPRPLFTDK